MVLAQRANCAARHRLRASMMRRIHSWRPARRRSAAAARAARAAAPRATAVAHRMVLAPAAAQVVSRNPTVVAAVAGVLIKQRLDRPSRPYEDGSGRSAAPGRGGILEHTGRAHPFGYYTDEELDRNGSAPRSSASSEGFIEAKYNFTQRMLDWGGVSGMQDAKFWTWAVARRHDALHGRQYQILTLLELHYPQNKRKELPI